MILQCGNVERGTQNLLNKLLQLHLRQTYYNKAILKTYFEPGLNYKHKNEACRPSISFFFFNSCESLNTTVNFAQRFGVTFFSKLDIIARALKWTWLCLNLILPSRKISLEDDDFVIMIEIKHQHCAIYHSLRTTHKSASLLTPEALARPQNILPQSHDAFIWLQHFQ